jgi:outer membrane biosynthesis protein TonB
MGHPEAQISMYSVHGSRGFGGIIPATIWKKHMRSMVKGTPVLDFPKPDWSKNNKSRSINSGSWISRTKALLEEKKEEILDKFFQEAQEEGEQQAAPLSTQSEPGAPKTKKPKPANKPKPEHGANIISQPETAYHPSSPSLPVAQPSPAPAPQPSPKPQPAPFTPTPETPPSNPAPVTSDPPSGNTGGNDDDNSSGRSRIPSLPRRHLQ